jgi:hypothetical protein
MDSVIWRLWFLWLLHAGKFTAKAVERFAIAVVGRLPPEKFTAADTKNMPESRIDLC